MIPTVHALVGWNFRLCGIARERALCRNNWSTFCEHCRNKGNRSLSMGPEPRREREKESLSPFHPAQAATAAPSLWSSPKASAKAPAAAADTSQKAAESPGFLSSLWSGAKHAGSKLYHDLTAWNFEGRDAHNGHAPTQDEINQDPSWRLMGPKETIYHDNNKGAAERKYVKDDPSSLFGLGGESHINFPPAAQDNDNLYASNDGTQRNRNFNSLTGVTGLSHTYFYNTTASAKTTLAVSGFSSKYYEDIIEQGKADKRAFYRKSEQVKYSLSHTFNKKFSARNQLTAGITADVNRLKLVQDYIKDGDSVLSNLLNTHETALLLKGFANFYHRFNDKLSTNTGLYYQYLTINNSSSVEPRWNLKYQFKPSQSLSFGAGLHSQLQPLDVYFYQTKNNSGATVFTNKDLGFVKSAQGVLGYDVNITKYFRVKTEIYGQYIYNAAVESTPSSFSMLNTGSTFGFPDKTDLVNNGKGYNYGLEITTERFLHKGLYYLLTVSVFESKYKGSDGAWRNTAFNSNYVINALGGKEIRLNNKTTFGIDTRFTITGGQRYTPFDIAASKAAGYVIYKEGQAYSLQQDDYLRWDLKFSYVRNLKKVTQKWYIDLQNVTGRKNIYIQTLNPKTGIVSQINQMGFFPNINYQITF